MRRFAASLRSEAGVTLTEMLVVMVLLGSVLAVAYMTMDLSRTMADTTQARAMASDQARSAIDGMTRELRQAREIVENGGGFVTAAERDCVFYADINHDSVPERIRYYVSGQRVYRVSASALTSAPPYTFGAYSAAVALPGALKSGWTGAVFTYWNGEDPPTAPAAIADISAVEIHLMGSASSGDRTADVDLTTSVKVRSVHNELN